MKIAFFEASEQQKWGAKLPLRLIVISMLPAFSIKSELQRLNVHAVWTNHYFEISELRKGYKT